MGAGVIAGAGLIYGITSVVKTLIDRVVWDNDGSNIGQEALNNSTIEHEHAGAGLIYGIVNNLTI